MTKKEINYKTIASFHSDDPDEMAFFELLSAIEKLSLEAIAIAIRRSCKDIPKLIQLIK